MTTDVDVMSVIDLLRMNDKSYDEITEVLIEELGLTEDEAAAALEAAGFDYEDDDD